MKKILRNVLMSVVLLLINYFLSKLEIPLMNNMIIVRFTYLINMIYAVYFNAFWCVGFAIIGDVLPFVISPPSYPFFPGYTISAVASILIYRYFLNNHELHYNDVLYCRLCVNIFINALLGALWIYILYKTNNFLLYSGASLLKNLVLSFAEAGVFLGIWKLNGLIKTKLGEHKINV